MQELVQKTHVQQWICRMGENVVFKSMIKNPPRHDLQKALYTKEGEDWYQWFWKMQLWLQELGAALVRLDMWFNSFVRVLEDLLFIPKAQIKHDIISVGFDGKSEEVNFKFDTCWGEVLKWESKLTTHDENLDSLGRYQEFFVSLQELNNMRVREDNLSLWVEVFFSLVVDQHGNEIN